MPKFDQYKENWAVTEGEEGNARSIFPIKIIYEDDDEEILIDTADDLRQGVAFKVLETRVRKIRRRKNDERF